MGPRLTSADLADTLGHGGRVSRGWLSVQLDATDATCANVARLVADVVVLVGGVGWLVLGCDWVVFFFPLSPTHAVTVSIREVRPL